MAYLRLIPSSNASELLFEKGNIVNVISFAKITKPKLSKIIMMPINANVNLELLNIYNQSFIYGVSFYINFNN